jgi:alanine dehydrogenase
MDAGFADLTIGFPSESGAERRTICTPAVARTLITAGFGVIAEPGIGRGVFIDDAAYAAVGVVFTDADRVWSAPLVLRYKSPDPADLGRLRPGQHLAALFHAEGDRALMAALKNSGVTAYSYEFLIEDGRFPLGRPGGQIAGVQAVFAGARALQEPAGRGVLLARIAGAAPAQVVVIGSGNVGAAAAHTAAALGAEVTVLTHSSRSHDAYRRSAPAGVAVQVNTRKRLLSLLDAADLVIGTILISTYDTPPMIGESDLARMRTGAVIVDATCGYGPGYLPTAGPIQRPGDPPRIVAGIVHVKVDVLPALVPVTSTTAYTHNATPYLRRIAQAALLGEADPAIEAARIVAAGHLVHPVLIQHAGIYGMRP